MRWIKSLLLFFFFLLVSVDLFAEDSQCPGVGDPPPPVLQADVPALISTLEKLTDTQARKVWTRSMDEENDLKDIFEAIPSKTKLEQFFQLLFSLQKNIKPTALSMIVKPPGITELLLAARVFTNPDFPQKITSVKLERDDTRRPPYYQVDFSEKEVRFPINRGRGFAAWDQGMCQIAKELVFSPGFSFRLRKARNSKNLIAYDFNKVEIFGQFGTRKIVSIDLNYVNLDRVEFIQGTDQGKVKVHVAKREFKENEHSRLFKLMGTLIPSTSQQRIDW